MDAVQEFSVQQNAVDVEYGNSAGGVINVVTKSGTNDYHGNLFYFGRNPIFNAKPYVRSMQPSTTRNHLWGASGGGPVFKDKLFTFLSYEGQRTKQPQQRIWTMATGRQLSGDFSQTFNADGSLRTIYDPWSTRPDPNNPGQYIRDAFQNNTIPAGRLDPTAVKLTSAWWKPNNPGLPVTGEQNFIANYFIDTKYFNFSNRTDWEVNEKLRLFGRYSRLVCNYFENDYTGGSIARNNNYASPPLARNIAGDAVYTIDPNTVLNFRLAYASLNESYSNPEGAINDSIMAQYWGSNSWYTPITKELPEFYYPALSGLGAEFGKGLWWLQPPHTYSLHGKLARYMGKHSLKGGMEWRRHSNFSLWPSPFTFNFNSQYTANSFVATNPKSGNAYATLLLGAIDNASGAGLTSPVHLEHRAWSAYFQDDFKLSPRITLNLGLRWEYAAALSDQEHKLSRFLDLTQAIPEFQQTPPVMPPEVTALRKAPPIYNGAFVFTDDNHPGSWDGRNEWMPRIGIAVRVTDKTAIRAGFARYVTPAVTVGQTLEAPQPNPYGWGGQVATFGYNAKYNVAPSIAGVPQARLSDPFPASNPIVPPKQKQLGRYTALGDDVYWNEQAQKSQYNDRYNISLQSQLPLGLAGDITWFYNRGERVSYNLSVNMVDPQLKYTHKDALNKSVPNPFYNYLTPDKFPGQLRYQKNVTVGSLLSPYPQYRGLTQWHTNGKSVRYNSLQAKLERRFGQGLALLWNYNYNQTKNQEWFNDLDQYANRFVWMPSQLFRHKINFAGVVEIPVGRGRAFGADLNKAADMIIGGWSASFIHRWRSANYLRFGTYQVSGDPSISNPTKDKLFDTSKFAVQPAYTPRSNPWQYDGVKGTGDWNLDFTLSKVIRLTERFNLEVRMEAYNLTNSVVWGEDGNTTNFSGSNVNFGKASSQRNMGREMQYMLKLVF
jgi:hypothetical protein